MKLRAIRITIDRLSHRQSCVPDLQSFAKFMTLAARVLYFPSVRNEPVQVRARMRCALGDRIGPNLEVGSGVNDVPPLLRVPAISKSLMTREHLVTRVALVPPPPALFNP
jgi:hypothetical protein